jgi:DNA-3-methyladenine glycosylase II
MRREIDGMATMTSFELVPQGPFSLGASAAFLEGFSPAAHRAADEGGHLHLAFVPDGEEAAAGVCLRDPVVGGLQGRWPGLRPVGFFSPYEAAAWALIGHRIRIVQAARIKERMAAALGQAVDVHGDVRHAFPGPGRLAGLEAFHGLSERKVANLRALGVEAMEGRLDGAWLRGLPGDEALRELKRLPGIGDFSAELVLLRGAGDPDHLPRHEPRLCRGAALAYGLDEPPGGEWLERRGQAWRPYRTWVALLLRVLLETETGDIGGTRNVGGRS